MGSDGRQTAEFGHLKKAAQVLLDTCYAIPAADFGPKMLKEVRARMIEMGWSRSYIKHQIQRTRRMFRWAALEEMVPPSVSYALKMLPGLRPGESGAPETAKRRAADPAVEATMPFLPPQVAAMVRLQ